MEKVERGALRMRESKCRVFRTLRYGRTNIIYIEKSSPLSQ